MTYTSKYLGSYIDEAVDFYYNINRAPDAVNVNVSDWSLLENGLYGLSIKANRNFCDFLFSTNEDGQNKFVKCDYDVVPGGSNELPSNVDSDNNNGYCKFDLTSVWFPQTMYNVIASEGSSGIVNVELPDTYSKVSLKFLAGGADSYEEFNVNTLSQGQSVTVTDQSEYSTGRTCTFTLSGSKIITDFSTNDITGINVSNLRYTMTGNNISSIHIISIDLYSSTIFPPFDLEENVAKNVASYSEQSYMFLLRDGIIYTNYPYNADSYNLFIRTSTGAGSTILYNKANVVIYSSIPFKCKIISVY